MLSTRNTLGIVILLIFYIGLAAQTIYTGKIIDETDQPMIGVIVSLNLFDKLHDHTTSDIDGNWRLEIPLQTDSVYLNLRYLGYQPHSILLDTISSVKSISVIKLEPHPTQLEEIRVTAERFAVQQRGDTSSYNIDVFLTGKERNLGDLLNNLPGLEISSQGDIKYNGKRIDKLYVDNRDILNDLHKLTTEGFSADDIAGIQIINNHKGDGNLTRRRSDEVALNIQLTEKAKNKWRGNIKSEIGYKERLNIDATLFNVGQIISSVTFAKFNNTGISNLSIQDFLALQTSLNRALNHNVSIAQLLPDDFLVPKELRSNADGTIASNWSFQRHEKSKTKVSLFLNRLDRQTDVAFDRSFRFDPIRYSGKRLTRHNLSQAQLRLNQLWQTKERNSFELEIPVNGTNSDRITEVDGLFNQTSISNRNLQDRKIIDIHPKLYYSQRIASRWIINSSVSAGILHQESTIDLEDIIPLLDSGDLSINQSVEDQTRQAAFSSEVVYEHNNVTAGVNYSYSSSTQFQQNRSNVESLEARVDLSRLWNSLLTYIRIKNDKWIFEPSLTLNLRTDEHTFIEQQSSKWIDISVLGKYSFSKFHFLLSRISYKQTPFSFQELNTNRVVINNQNIRQNEIPTPTQESARNILLNYLNYDVPRNLRLSLQVQLQSFTNGRIIRSEIFESFIQSSLVNFDRQSTFSVRQDLSKKIRYLGLKVGFANSLTRTFQYIDTDNQITSYQRSHRVSFKTTTKKEWDFEFSAQFQRIQTISSASTQPRGFNTLGLGTVVHYKRDKWFFTIPATLNLTRIANSQSVSFLDLDLSVDYHLVNHWSLSLNASDLLNLRGTLNQSVDFTPNFTESREFIRFPGYVNIGVKFQL
jgi:hypothetical protein